MFSEKMDFQQRRIAILGASGSIGSQALEIIIASGGKLTAELLTVHSETGKLVEQANQFHPKTVVITNPEADRSPLSDLDPNIEVLFGSEALDQAVCRPEIDIVLSGIVGGVGLSSVRSALAAGKRVALANKESLVMAGEQLLALARKSGGRLIPVDSEHSAIYQCLQARRLNYLKMRSAANYIPGLHDANDLLSDSDRTIFPFAMDEDVSKLILTASGGPFRSLSCEEIHHVSIRDALKHPTWKMGKKITIDSATLMNKAFEMVEARWLFGLPAEKIQVVIHPQSIVHSMVEFIDGAVVAQMSPPDMRLPIQLALTEPYRFEGPMKRLDWNRSMALEFIPPDLDRFPAIALGFQIVELGGTAGVVVNAADEVAVEAFLNGKLAFDKIVPACQGILDNHYYDARPSFEQILDMDAWARKETEKWIAS
ncbi:MAG: 1-deoxy-D-xylulose-5-phosphate reductoisomerase [Planctomycetia bacterium]|nr:1-deoxy-D-xylulose-5-phosphate reductoisomerase [Planctomycetia bacterium]